MTCHDPYCLVILLISLILPLPSVIAVSSSSSSSSLSPPLNIHDHDDQEAMKMTRKFNTTTSLESTDTGVATNLRPWKGQTLLRHHKHQLVRNAHGILNIIGWGTLLPVGAIIARYLRKLELYDEWYPLHILCQSSGYLLGTLGWGIGLWLGNSSKQYTLKTHRILSILVFTFSTIQMLAVFVHPRIRDEFRKCWVIYHKIMGYALIALIIANIFQGATHQNHSDKWKWVYVGVLAILALIALALEVFRWIIKYRIQQ
ncbi:hypothetical protein Ddye_019739 [Dipteronia dyeriana]|uniref:Cytochrome b561 domain-containing protein n=1 Tax=Dipteronia dyeriana TaxID=168575 RepID=A0AAD9TYC8_9ROSI|nr:hypothetical protein Ddye_019739 [Dipteronia dyeriana]